MPAPLLVVSPSLCAARAHIGRRLRPSAGPKSIDRDEVLILGESNAHARPWRDLWLDLNSTAPGAFLPQLESLTRWFFEAATAVIAPRWITPSERLFLLRRITATQGSKLKLLERLSDTNDLANELGGLIADLRQGGQQHFKYGGDWGDDLKLLVDEYNRALERSQCVDAECAPAIWAQESAKSDNSVFNGHVVFDQLLFPSPVEWCGMCELTAQAQSTQSLVALPWLEVSPDLQWDEVLSQARGSVAERVLRLWRETGAELEVVLPQEARDERYAQIAAWWRHQESTRPAHLTITPAHTTRDEIERIASHLRARCKDDASSLNECTLVLPNPASYDGALVKGFEAHGVPLALHRPRAHSEFPLVARVLALLSQSGGEWNLNDLADLFSDGLLSLKSNGHAFDIRRLRNACFARQVSGLRDVGKCRERLRNDNGEFDDELENDLQCFAKLRDLVEALPEANGATAWHEALVELLDCVVEGDANIVQRDAVLSAAQHILDYDADWSKCFGSENRSAAIDWNELLQLELESEISPLEVVATPHPSIAVTSAFELNKAVPRVLYFAGLTESEYPPASWPGTLLSRHRNELRDLRSHRAEPAQLARYQLALALTEAREVHLFYPAWRGGREVLRSPVFEDFELSWKSIPQLERPASPTSRAQLLAALGTQSRNAKAEEFADGWYDLLEAVGCDADSLMSLQKMQRERSAPDFIGEYDGALGKRGAPLLSSLASEKPQNATDLKNYAQCPLKFWFKNVLRVGPVEELRDDLSEDQNGELIHTIIEKFARHFIGAFDTDHQDEAWRSLEAIARVEIEKCKLRPILSEALERQLLGDGRTNANGLLGNWLLAELAQASNILEKPPFAQPLVALGRSKVSAPTELGDGVEYSFREDVNGVPIVGRIDRVLASQDGAIVGVIDYKTGNPNNLPKFTDADIGHDFQLPLYLLGLRSMWRRHAQECGTEMPLFTAAFFATGNSQWCNGLGEGGTLGFKTNKRSKARELESEKFENWLSAEERRLSFLQNLMRAAQFNLSFVDAKKAGCKYCDYRFICRRDDALARQREHSAQNGKLQSSQPVYLYQSLLEQEDDA